MLRVVPSGNAAAAQRYYASALKREDYYSRESPGQWHGLGAELLGLSGEVSAEQFAALTECRDSVTGEKLTPRINAERIAGYDLNFHAPKSLSVLQAMTGDADLLRVFREAASETMNDIEKLAATRVRLNGQQDDRRTSNLVWAEFVHFTSRPVDGIPDSHLHVHQFCMNLTFDHVEGRWKAAKFHDIKAEAPVFEAMFHSRLAKKVVELGYSIRRTRNRWEIVGVPESVMAKHSRRTAEIESLAKKLGILDAKQKDALGAKTRAGKRKGLTREQLLASWNKRLTEEERAAIFRVREEKPKPAKLAKVTVGEALDFAEEKCFERDSVVKRSKLVAAALRYGVGHMLPADIDREMERRNYIERSYGGDLLCTTPAIMVEEAELIQRVRSGRGKLAPIIPGRLKFARGFLSKEQREAVRHVLQSNDQVIAIRGVAGAGKTTAMQEVREQLEAAGVRIFAFAQSAEASRGVLRESGFSDADTVARLLADKDLQLRTRGGVIFIDESGIVGIRDLAKIMEIAGESTRVVLVGDTAQHAPVARGDAVRVLEEYSGIPVAAIRQIRRQEQLGYREAVKALSEGDTTTGFAILESIGAVVEVQSDVERYRLLATEYFRCLDDTGQAPLVVSPTHAEGRAVTRSIREQLAERGKLGPGRLFLQYRDLKWEQAEKRRPENYSLGLVLQFHQNAKGIKRGSLLPVVGVDAENKSVLLGLPNGTTLPLDWKATDRFQVFEKAEIALAKGDLLKITRNGFDSKGRRISNGTVLMIKKIGPDGKLVLENGIELSSDHGHIEHGYCHTSHSSQGKTVREVFVAQSSTSFLAASKEGFYVSCSRGKENIRIFTDDKLELQRAIGNSSRRLSALEFGGIGKEVFMTPGLDGVEWVKRIGAEKARRHEPATHVEKLMTARRMDPNKKPEVLSFQEYINMRRANVEADGKSRSKGSGPSKAKERGKGINDPRRVMKEQPTVGSVKPANENAPGKAKSAEPKKAEPKSRIGKRIESAKQHIKAGLEMALPPKSIGKGERKTVGLGNIKVKVADLGNAASKKLHEQRERRNQRTQEKKIAKPKPPTPPVRRK